ncbi:MAG: hypothetical protein ACYC0V_11465 [Armatimonadota bacterium]
MTREIVSIIGIVVVIAFFIFEVKGWNTGKRAVNRRQKGLRTASMLLLLAILVMMLIGDEWLKPYLMGSIVYWMSAFLFAVIIMILAMIDLHEVRKGFRAQVHDMVKDLLAPEDSKKDEGDGGKTIDER